MTKKQFQNCTALNFITSNSDVALYRKMCLFLWDEEYAKRIRKETHYPKKSINIKKPVVHKKRKKSDALRFKNLKRAFMASIDDLNKNNSLDNTHNLQDMWLQFESVK